jgi:flagellar hook-associated protein FlgK
MSSTVFSTALSGVAAASTQLDVASHNISNAQTPHFKRQTVVQTAQPEGGVSTAIRSSPVDGSALSQDIITQLSSSYSYKANLQVIETANGMSGTLVDLRA